MAHIEEIMVNGVLTSVNSLDSTAQEVDDAVSASKWQTNPNLLDNWYFANPVNQRGQTEYTSGYTIDRWRFNGSNQKLTIQNDGILLECGAAYAMYLVQYLENALAKSIAGKKVTFSVLSGEKTGTITFAAYVNGAWTTSLIPVANGLVSKTFTVSNAATSFRMEFGGDTAGTLKVIAVKLELGPVQTLAHQDENGNWVLNDSPPNKALELLKCQRYQMVYAGVGGTSDFAGIGMVQASSGTSVSLYLQTPVVLRANPTITVAGTLGVVGDDNLTWVSQSIALDSPAYATHGTIVTAPATSGTSVFTAGKVYRLRAYGGAKIILDANL